MNVLIVYDTVHGNTEQLAQSMARALSPVASVSLEKAGEISSINPEGFGLVIVGGPTHHQRISAALASVLEATDRGRLKGVNAAAFDTRYRMAAWLSGSAAQRIARHLKKLGARVVASPESFFIERDVPPKGQKRRHELEHLEPGEAERAAQWVSELV